jgi:hypothetical protein
MGKGPCAFKEADITRAYRAAKKAGVIVEIKLSLDRKEMTLTPVKVIEPVERDPESGPTGEGDWENI